MRRRLLLLAWWAGETVAWGLALGLETIERAWMRRRLRQRLRRRRAGR